MIWSIIYEYGNQYYSMQVLGTELEATTHAHNLGLSDPELVHENIEFDGHVYIGMGH